MGKAMALVSDLSMDIAKFEPSLITPETTAFNHSLQKIMSKGPKWYEVGAAEYRVMRARGETPLPAPVLCSSASTLSIPSRDPGRQIPCRVIKPSSPSVSGIFMHVHGGGWVLDSESSSDQYLQAVADACGLVCISIGYRLSPEHPFPAGPNDCFDAATWLIENGVNKFRTPLAYIGGESAGANLALLSVLHLLRSSSERHNSFRLRGVLFHYGTFSLRWQASTKNFKRAPTLVLDEDLLDHFRSAYLPGFSVDEMDSPDISPFFASLRELDLPPALFTCGTEDCLLEDSVFMSARWMMNGGESILKIFPGSPHGFIMFPKSMHENTWAALQDVKTFISLKNIESGAVESFCPETPRI